MVEVHKIGWSEAVADKALPRLGLVLRMKLVLSSILPSRFSALITHPAYQQNRARVLWRVGLWSLHCLLGIPARAKFRRWNFRLFLPAKWRGGGSTAPYLFREHYEPELMLLERFLKPGMVVIDGGANTGVYTFVAAQLVGPSGQVLSFEPGSDSFEALRRSREINRWDHVCLRSEALADRTGMARLYHHFGQENSYSLGEQRDVDFEEVPTISLDEAARVEQLPRIDFIKLDVEGAEELVLRGASSALGRWRPIVLFEVNQEMIGRLHLDPIGASKLLESCSYCLFSMSESGALTRIERVPNQVSQNLLAIPKERCDEEKRFAG